MYPNVSLFTLLKGPFKKKKKTLLKGGFFFSNNKKIKNKAQLVFAVHYFI